LLLGGIVHVIVERFWSLDFSVCLYRARLRLAGA
jgi:hypothetical protein